MAKYSIFVLMLGLAGCASTRINCFINEDKGERHCDVSVVRGGAHITAEEAAGVALILHAADASMPPLTEAPKR